MLHAMVAGMLTAKDMGSSRGNHGNRGGVPRDTTVAATVAATVATATAAAMATPRQRRGRRRGYTRRGRARSRDSLGRTLVLEVDVALVDVTARAFGGDVRGHNGLLFVAAGGSLGGRIGGDGGMQSMAAQSSPTHEAK